jgi:hypothetical protein
MRFVLAATLLAGLSACPAAAQWDDDRPTARRSDDDRRGPDGPRFRADDDDGRRDRREFGSRDPDEIMPRRRDREREFGGRRRDRDDRDRRDAESRWDDRSRADRYDRYGPPAYGTPGVPPAAPGGVFVVPPPIPGARSY